MPASDSLIVHPPRPSMNSTNPATCCALYPLPVCSIVCVSGQAGPVLCGVAPGLGGSVLCVPAIGHAHSGQATARSDTFLPQSGHLTSAMSFSLVSGSAARGQESPTVSYPCGMIPHTRGMSSKPAKGYAAASRSTPANDAKKRPGRSSPCGLVPRSRFPVVGVGQSLAGRFMASPPVGEGERGSILGRSCRIA